MHQQARDLVTFHRRGELPGVELRRVERSSSRWRCFATGFEFLVPETWHGEAIYQRRRARLGPRDMLCMHPGEIFATTRVHLAGDGSAITIDPDVFHAHLAAYVRAPHEVRLPWLLRPSRALASRHADLCRVMRAPEATALALQSGLVRFIAALASELAGAPAPSPVAPGRRRALARQVRDRLLCVEEERVNLDRLAREAGVSRFCLLRAFKEEFGLPPRAYELRFRIGRAQLALAAGDTPAAVAAQYGFTDQSHLCAHFKRLVGVTPSRYAGALRR